MRPFTSVAPSRAFWLSLSISSSILFALTALASMWAVYDRLAAANRLVLILLGVGFVLVLPFLAQRDTDLTFGGIGLFCAVATFVLAAYFFLVHDWTVIFPGDFIPWQPLALWIQDHRPQVGATGVVQGNRTAQALIVLLPLGWAGVAWLWRHGWRGLASICGLFLLFGLAALLLSFSRGGWLGLGIGFGCALFLGLWYKQSCAISRGWVGDSLVVSILLMFAGYFGLTLLSSALAPSINFLVPTAVLSHAQLWRDTIALLQDYRFTGTGLIDSTMIYSTYVFLLHVPFLSHAHNVYLQVGLEQGIPGLIAFLCLAIAAVGLLLSAHRQRLVVVPDFAVESFVLRFFLPATMVSLLALLIHGVFEAEAYASTLVPLLFLPLASAVAIAVTVFPVHQTPARRWHPVLSSMGGAALPVLLITAIFFLPGARAALLANRAVIAQTRAELSVYVWPEWPMQDALRRDPQIDLEPAVADYTAALSLNPRNAAANRRLGQIELSRGDYAQAWQHLDVAFTMMPGNRVTRQMLGEAYAALGDIEQASLFWQAQNISRERLESRQWWYDYVDAQPEATYIAEAIALFSVGK